MFFLYISASLGIARELLFKDTQNIIKRRFIDKRIRKASICWFIIKQAAAINLNNKWNDRDNVGPFRCFWQGALKKYSCWESNQSLVRERPIKINYWVIINAKVNFNQYQIYMILIAWHEQHAESQKRVLMLTEKQL